MPLTNGILIPSSTNKAWNPESKSALDSITWGRGLVTHYDKKNLVYSALSISKVCQSLQGNTYLQRHLFSLECIEKTFCFHIRIS